MKLASFNMENLFTRARALNQETWSDGRDPLKQHAELNELLNRPKYSAACKKRIVALLKALGLSKSDEGGDYAILRQNRGRFLRRSKSGSIEIVAGGRRDWTGWVDLKLEEVNEVATQNTARVVATINPDVLATVEVESRLALLRFSEHIMPAVHGKAFAHAMLIDGNDERGIDVGVLSREGFDIVRMQSHVDDEDRHGTIFSRDCPEYVLRTPGGDELVLLVNHLKSKGFGAQRSSAAKRLRQARRVKRIYERLLRDGHQLVAVLGDFNDTPDSSALKPLLEGTNLRDVSTHPAFEDGGRPGTFGSCTSANKIDYILLSPRLFARISGGGIFRAGIWSGSDGTLFPHFSEITSANEAASDHAAIWCEVEV